MDGKGWIGVDLDGALAHYDGWVSIDHIGEPVPAMLQRVKDWLAAGKDVRIFTARVSCPDDQYPRVRAAIDTWTTKHLGRALPVTCFKDMHMVQLWDDRCVQVKPNTGAPVEPGVPTAAVGETEFVIPDAMRKRLENDFVYHSPKNDQAVRYAKIRDQAKQLAYYIAAKTPPSREQSVALTKLEEAIFFANAAIARNE